jgi:U3 small nucleolar RNA-associated protein 18
MSETRKRRREAPQAREAPAADAEEERLASLVFGAVPAGVGGKELGSVVAVRPHAKKAAWHDADDEGVAVDLAGTARLRKLRVDREETVVSGAEYQERARSRLSAAAGVSAGESPAWALAPSQRKRKGRRSGGGGAGAGGSSGGADGEGGSSGEEEEKDGDELEQLLRRAGPLTQRSSALPTGKLAVTRLRDANAAAPARAVVQALGWHPEGTLLMTAALDANLRFFRIDGRKNVCVSTVLVRDLPITSAAWSGDGGEVIATGRRPFFYTYDVGGGALHRVPRLLGRNEKSLESCVVSPGQPSSSTSLIAFLGSGGNIICASAATKSWVANLKMNGDVRAAAFSAGPTGGGRGAGPLDYAELLSTGTDGVVYVWDLRTLTCRGKHADEGAGAGGSTSIAVTRDGSRYAVGSASGVVNTYKAATALDRPASASSLLFEALPRPTPDRTIDNLSTSISTLAWGPGGDGSGDLLLAASQRTHDALKLIHGGAGRVFSNWPTDRTPLNYVTAASFSPGGAYLTVGNDKGRVLLYRLHHYGRG